MRKSMPVIEISDTELHQKAIKLLYGYSKQMRGTQTISKVLEQESTLLEMAADVLRDSGIFEKESQLTARIRKESAS